MAETNQPFCFKKLLADELALIQARRSTLSKTPVEGLSKVDPDTLKETETVSSKWKEKRVKMGTECARMDLTGLALSGGGIRSATFCLGFLQGLHAFGLLSMFDYLSTVSGGGFVGGFWSAWLARTQYSLDVADISWPEGWDTAQFKCLHLDKVNKLLWCYGRLYSPEDRDGVLRAFKQAVETAKSESVQVDAAQSAYDKNECFFSNGCGLSTCAELRVCFLPPSGSKSNLIA